LSDYQIANASTMYINATAMSIIANSFWSKTSFVSLDILAPI